MGLIIGIILLALIYATHLPATNGLREGKEHFRRMKDESREHWRDEAAKQDRYYDYRTGTMNQHFYSDGSLRHDIGTGNVYKKGEYYCNSRGVTADWKYANDSMPRPKK